MLNGSPFFSASRAFFWVPPKGASTIKTSALYPFLINPELILYALATFPVAAAISFSGLRFVRDDIWLIV